MISKKENICEISLIGIPKLNELNTLQQNFNELFFASIEEVFENVKMGYEYNVTTLLLDSPEFENRTINTIELYSKKMQQEFVIDTEYFYNSVKYANKIEEYLILSANYIKYISNIMVKTEVGNASIVELSRCDDKMIDVLKTLGYKESFQIKKKGHVWRYRNQPIVGIYYKFEKKENENWDVFEINGYFRESEKDNMIKTFKTIKSKLNSLFYFEHV